MCTMKPMLPQVTLDKLKNKQQRHGCGERFLEGEGGIGVGVR